MATRGALIPLGWGSLEVPLHSYVAFYYSTPEAVRRSLSFLRVGLDEPDTFCIFLAEESRIDGLLSQLQDGSAQDLIECIGRGKLVAASWDPNFEGLVDTLMARLDRALADGYVRIRAMGLVAWDRVGWGDPVWLKRCERAMNMSAAMFPMVILCTYNIPQIAGHLLRETGEPDEPRIVVNQAMGPIRSGALRVAMSLSRRMPGRA